MKKKLWHKFILITAVLLLAYALFGFTMPFFQFLGFTGFHYKYDELESAVQELLPERGFVYPGTNIEVIDIEKNYSTAVVICTDGNEIFAVGFQAGCIPTYSRMDNIGRLPTDTTIEVSGRYPFTVYYSLSEAGGITAVKSSIIEKILDSWHVILVCLLIAHGSTFGKERLRRQKEKELEYEERRKNTKSFAEMAWEEKEAKQREQEQDTNPK